MCWFAYCLASCLSNVKESLVACRLSWAGYLELGYRSGHERCTALFHDLRPVHLSDTGTHRGKLGVNVTRHGLAIFSMALNQTASSRSSSLAQFYQAKRFLKRWALKDRVGPGLAVLSSLTGTRVCDSGRVCRRLVVVENLLEFFLEIISELSPVLAFRWRCITKWRLAVVRG